MSQPGLGNNIRQTRPIRPRSRLRMLGLGVILAFAVFLATLWQFFDLSPLDVISRLTQAERISTATSGESVERGFDSFLATSCGTQYEDFPLLVENEIESDLPIIGGLVERVGNAISLDNAAFVVRGSFDVVVPFTEGDGFELSIDHENQTARVYIERFVIQRPNGDPLLVARAQGIATMLSAEDPLFAQAQADADEIVAEKAANGAGDWFEECELQLTMQWKSLGGWFDYDTTVVVMAPRFPLEVRMDSADTQTLEEVLTGLDP